MFASPAIARNAPDSRARDSQPPRLPLLLREVASFAVTRARASFASAVTVPKTRNGSDIVVLPGFMASDVTTARLRRSLNAAGHNAHGWGLGRNYGIQKDVFERVNARLDALGLDGPVTLVGWSLGGIIAREYAKHAPHRVNRVVTLGTPFSGDPRANNAWRLYEMVAGYKVDAPPIDAILEEKPPMQTLAFWSRRDGVVAPRSARGKAGQSDRQIELRCTHMAFVADPAAIRAICQAIAS